MTVATHCLSDMNGLTLKIFSHSEDTKQLKDVGIDFDYKDCDIDNVTFYRIDAIADEKDGDDMYTGIYSNGGRFVCPLSPDEVKSLIGEAHYRGNLK